MNTGQSNRHTLQDAGFWLCRDCHQINRITPKVIANLDSHDVLCARCGAAIHPRVTDSISRTWALLLTAFVLFIPANLYPIMIVDSIAGQVASTIMEGIVLFIESGEYFVAFVIFTASIVVPAFKLVGLSVILYSIQTNSPFFRRHRSAMFRFIQFIGRWSMLDIFVVSIMVAIVQFGILSQIRAGFGATAFALVVIITMYAAQTFDPRLIWEGCPPPDTTHTNPNPDKEEK